MNCRFLLASHCNSGELVSFKSVCSSGQEIWEEALQKCPQKK